MLYYYKNNMGLKGFTGVIVEIKVALLGMDKRSKDRMMAIFNMNFKGQCKYAEPSHSDAVILDMDNKNIEAEWHQFKSSYPDKPAIILSKEHLKISGALYVAKPVKLAELLEALKISSNKEISINLKTGKSFQKTAAALENRFQQPRKKNVNVNNLDIFYKPENFLQGKVIEAVNESKKTNKNVLLKCWPNRWFIIFPSTDQLLQNINDKQISKLNPDYLNENIIYNTSSFSINEFCNINNIAISKAKITSINKFIWNITVKTALGRIPEGTSLDTVYQLSQWPNLPGLTYIPNATKISAFWIGQSLSINNIVGKLNIPQEDVLTYFSAVRSIGLLKQAKRNEDKLFSPDTLTTDNKKEHSIFTALYNKVSKNISRNLPADNIYIDQ